MKQKLLRGLGAVLAAALVLSAGMLLRQNFQYREAERTYAEAEDLAGLRIFPKFRQWRKSRLL